MTDPQHIIDVIEPAARRVMPEGRYRAFMADLEESKRWLSAHGAIEILGTIQDIYNTPASRRVIHHAIGKLNGTVAA